MGCIANRRWLALVWLLPLSVATTAEPRSELSSATETSVVESAWFPLWLKSSGYWLEQQRDAFSSTVTESATGVDAYLARDNIDPLLANDSYLKIQVRQRFGKSGERNMESSIRARLRLPNSRRRLKLTFESSPDDFETLSGRNLGLPSGTGSATGVDDRAVAGIGLDKILGDNWDSSFNVGIKLRLPLDPYIRASWTHTGELGPLWTSRFMQRFSYFHSEGWKSEEDLNFYRPLNATWLFQSSSAAQYLDKENSWEFFQRLSLHQRISADSAFEHQVGISAISRPSLRTNGYWLRTELRHRLYKDWLHAKVAPELFLGRDGNFDLEPSLFFELEMFFGSAPR